MAATTYWGTPDQPAHPDLAARGHPAYRNQCIVYAPQLFFGKDRTSAPTIELGLRRQPFFSWLPNSNVSDDCNPVTTLADVLTHPLYGLGLDPALIDQAQWAAAAHQIAGEDAVCSPLLADPTGARQFIASLCEYFGGYLRWTAGNRLQIGLLREPPADLTTLPNLTASHLVEPPQIETAEWGDTFNRTIVKCTERERGWKEDYGQWIDQGNYALTQQMRVQNLERRWITRRGVATLLAQRVGKVAALPRFDGSLRVRASAARNLGIGDWLVLEWEGWDFVLILQVTARKVSSDAMPEVELEVTGQRVSEDPALLYDPDDVINHDPGTPDVQPLAQWRVLELPRALVKQAADPYVTLLAVRGGPETVGAYLLDSPDDATYDLLATITDFCWGGTLAVDYPDDTPNTDTSVGLLVTLVGPDTDLPAQSDAAMRNNKLLVFAGNEIMALRQITYLPGNQVRLHVKRGRMDTRPLDHAAGEEVYIIRRRRLARLRQDEYADDLTQWFKPQPFSPGQVFDLSIAPAQQVTFTGRALAPQPFRALTINGQASDPATFASGSDIAFGWTLATNETFGDEAPDEDYYSQSGLYSFIAIFSSVSDLTRRRKLLVAPGQASITLSNADLRAAFGGAEPASFYVRLWAKKAGRRSYGYEQATVNRT